MNLHNAVKATGDVFIQLDKADGTTQNVEIHNLVVNTGLNFIVSRMKDTTAGAMSHMALGAGTVPAAGANTGLGSELGRAALTSTTVSGNTITYVATFGAGVGTGAVTEAGILNAGSAGTMLCRTVFPVVNKQALDSMTITWVVTIA